MSAIADRGYRHPEALVSTEWVAAHTGDPHVRIIESNGDEQHWIFDRLETNLKPPVNPAELEPFDRNKIK